MSIVDKLQVVSKLRQQGKRIVLAHGCFDLLHIGHIRHLSQASMWGEILVVTVTPDEFVNKGDGRPVFSADVRAECLQALVWVNYALINEWPTAAEAIRLLVPHVFAKGPECRDKQTPELQEEIAAAQEVGCEVLYTPGEIHSSTDLLGKVVSFYA